MAHTLLDHPSHLPLALPLHQGHVIDPFVKWNPCGILVRMEPDADPEGGLRPYAAEATRGTRNEPCLLHVINSTQVEQALEQAYANFGRLDVLVNNAGTSLFAATEEASDEQIRDLFDANYFGMVRVLRAVLPLMRKQHPPAFAEERRSIRTSSGRLKVDGIGIALIGLGSGALEVVLDRGEIDDWFGSRFILCASIMAVISLVTAVAWELKQEDPVIEFRLLRIRNFAIANLFYFVFGFGLFASTTMIPQILQTLYGYRAMDAGLVLGPGAFVITLLAPVGAQIVQRGIIPPRYLLLASLIIVGISFLHYGRLDLQTDYAHYAWARAVQGLGYAFFFVPLTVIAYSELKPDQNNKASSLTNFFRNWGGSFGIAFINTVSDRRFEFHQSVVGASLFGPSLRIKEQIDTLSRYLTAHGMDRADSARAAYGYIYSRLGAQAHFLAFMDCFWIIGMLTLVVAPAVLLTRSFAVGSKPSSGH